ncbi:ABC-2 type transport system ATP-binding protein [Desulfatibacillum alkenivorans DSM 16219]|jgi:ABC-2 type transport system ATP-binding protein|uniref:ABC-2 type transport system ATP-binding protein n=1 Tax=Desulfatibacillum alkenivorans DSM 16219 TaxID=1121393 RepID=A0A1M6N9Z1_9BACT|nr:ABC transporter ATP-binding protein [Desulfatibacillum alkenivorans]SHJ92467.1 ABC-2 type transport system ATP-binding protein [Desulfatibacillum alkenivorans DSM 16219]
MEPVIQCRNLRHSYNGKKQVLNNLNFTVEAGKIFGLLGKNGAGKSTTINILMGFLEPTSGDCRIFGEPSYNISPQTRTRIGLLHEGHLQYEFMSIAQIDRFYSGFYAKWNRDVYYELMEKLGLPHNHKIFRMSCGQRSQVALGLIMAQDPDLMILDDYSMGLDAGYRRLFLDYLAKFVRERKKTALVTSHIVQDMEQLVDDIIILNKGKVIVQSSLKEFQQGLRHYRFTSPDKGKGLHADEVIANFDAVEDQVNVFSFHDKEAVEARLKELQITNSALSERNMTLEEAFIGLTGKY